MALRSITRVGDLENAHDGCPERPLAEGDSRVTVFGQAVGRIGDRYEPHESADEEEHRDWIQEGISAVTAFGIPIATVGCLVATGGHGSDTTVKTGEDRCSVSTSWTKENGHENGARANIDRVKAFKPTKKHSIILCMPKICDGMASTAEDAGEAQGWSYLKAMFDKWLAGYARFDAESNSEAFFVDINWLINARSVAEALADLRTRILNDKAKDRLRQLLFNDGLIGESDIVRFDYIKYNDDSQWLYRGKHQHQVASVDMMDEWRYGDKGVLYSMRNFSLYGLAKGFVTRQNDERHLITVEKTGVIAWDTFAFSEKAGGVERFLGRWNCEERKYSIADPNYTPLFDKDFIDFQNEHNCGNNFVVTSNVYIFNDFILESFYYE